MREFSTRTTEGHYTIIFETDERKAFEQVQTLCRRLVDGKDGDAIPIEWIDKYLQILATQEDKEWEFMGIEEMLEDWREERAENDSLSLHV